MADDPRPLSAAELAATLGDNLTDPDELPESFLDLVRAARRLSAALVSTDADADDRATAAATLDRISDMLEERIRDPLIHLGRNRNGRVVNLTQAGSGLLNPQALPIDFEPVPAPADHDTTEPIEVRARVTLTAAHSGPPQRVHGGVVATLLDEVIGTAAVAGAARGMTAGLNVRYRRATPYDAPLTVTARLDRTDGRKAFATGEVRSDGQITAEGEVIFVAPADAE